MSVGSVGEARAVIAAGGLGQFVGTRECAWLDVKKEPYKLGNPAQDVELLKDVAALANSVGGLLLVGFGTIQQNGREVVGELHPVPVGSVDAERYRKVLRERLVPLVRGLSVDWVAIDDAVGVLVIDVPEQPEASKPFVVPGRNDTEGLSVPIRDDDGTLWLSRTAVQRLLNVGWNAQGGLDREAILELIRQMHIAPTTAPKPAFHLGQDAPTVRTAFEGAWAAAGGEAALGLPTRPVEQLESGFVQHLAGGAVLCSIDGRSAVVVDDGVWEAIARIGADAGVTGGEALGLPVAPAGASGSGTGRVAVIGESCPEIALAGGSWGPGKLVRSQSGAWLWRPVPRVDFQMLSDYRSSLDPVDLRLRAVARLPLVPDATSGRPRVDRSGRSRLEAELRHCELNNLVSVLCLRRGGSAPASAWHWPTGNDSFQSDRSGHYRWVLASPEGESGLTAEVMVQLVGDTQITSMIACVELRVRLAPWRDLLRPAGGGLPEQPADLRLTVEDLLEFFLVAWPTATLIVPCAALPTPTPEVPLAGPVRVEFRFDIGTPGAGQRPQAEEVLDFAAFGAPTRQVPGQGGFAVTAALDLPRDDRRRLLAQGLTELAQAWGFIDADAVRL